MTATTPHSRNVTVYEPTVTGLPPLGPYLRGIWDRRPFIWHLSRTELKARHYDTAIGQFWLILEPLVMAGVYYLLRTVIRPIGTVDRNAVLSHIIWAVFFFRFVAGCLQVGAKSVLGNKQMILNTSFPRAIFPIVAVVVGFLDFIPTIGIYLVLHGLLHQPFGLALITLPLIVAILTVFALGVALLFAPLTVFFRDVNAILPYITQIWLYATPVLYSVSEIPPNLLPLLRLNPLYPFYGALGQVFNAQWPSPVYLLAATAWALVSFFVGAVVFLVRERDFAIRF
jgi:teichoic acid transport system permease protein